MPALPNAIVVGAAKAGTTSLCQDLEQHPDIYFYHSKETHYFSFNYHKGLNWYKSLFSPSGQPIIMEGTPEYTTSGNTEEIARRMHEVVPDAQLIYMVRHPIQRLESNYVQEIANAKKNVLPFSKAVTEWHLLDGSLYEKNYLALTKYFDPDKIFILFLDDYKQDKKAVLSGLFSFLGIPNNDMATQHRNAQNTRADKYSDPYIYKFIRRIPGFYRIKGAVPSTIKQALKQALGRKIDVDIVWDEAVKKVTIDAIKPDMVAFLKRCGKSTGYWNLDG